MKKKYAFTIVVMALMLASLAFYYFYIGFGEISTAQCHRRGGAVINTLDTNYSCKKKIGEINNTKCPCICCKE